jgi:hypothetical protein
MIHYRITFALLIALLSSCGMDDGPSADEGWSCESERDGWERCDGSSVIWCHATSHGDLSGAHFHEGTNCGQDGLECVAIDEQTAACADPATTCDMSFAECDDRYARNCVDGRIASMRCSLAETCEVLDEGARCVPAAQE